MKQIFEIRYENGASHIVEAKGFGSAAKIARESLRSCLPKTMPEEHIVRITTIRNLTIQHCVICGMRMFYPYIIRVHTGRDAQLCRDCAIAASTATLKKVGEELLKSIDKEPG